MQNSSAIGIFDSGFGGLTIFKSIAKLLPEYNYIYLGDNARSPYGDHDFDTIYKYTLECVNWLFEKGCPLVILACNTASAKALRNIQQLDLPKMSKNRRVLGVIRPTAEIIGKHTKSKQVGVMGTRGTVNSSSYVMEINKFYPALNVYQQSCPLWVPLIENNEHLTVGADYFVDKYCKQLLEQQNGIDCVLLACTHYPMLLPKLKDVLPKHIEILTQGDIVAQSLADYLNRHQEITINLSKESKREFYTSGDTKGFDAQASIFFEEEVQSGKM